MMAEELDDGEFWLPSEILTDDDFFDGLASSGSVTAGSTGSESDEDTELFLAGLTQNLTRSAISAPAKGLNLSTSPQSTLCGFGGAAQGSSRGSPAEVVSPPPAAAKDDGGATWDLLYKAAGEVARMKLRNETVAAGGKVGTGFFDCSAAKRPFCPPPPPPAAAAANMYPQPVHFQPHFPPLSHLRQHQHHHHQQQQIRSNSTNSNRPLGLPPSAWPPLQAQAQAQKQPVNPSGPSIFLGQQPKRESVGTGVFLPRRPTETRKKSETNGAKNRGGKAGNNKSQQQQRSTKPPAVNPKAIQLPQEWTY